MHAGSIKELIPHAKRAGFVATCLAAAIAASFGWSQGEGYIGKACLATGLALASFIVGYSLVFANAAWAEGKKGIALASTALFAVAVCVELLSHLGFTAASRQADLTQARHQTNTYTDTRGELDRARAELTGIKQVRPAATISSQMANLEARPWFAGTKSCVEPGRYGNSCRQYQALKGELAASQERARLDKRIQTLTAQAANTSAGHSTIGAQSTVLASVASMSTKPTAEQEFWTNIGISALMAIFFVMSGLLNLIAYAFETKDEIEAKTAEIITPIFRAPPQAQPSVDLSVGRAVLPRAANG